MSNTKNLDIVFRGKTYKIGKNEKYKNITQVAKVLKVPTAELKAYRSSSDKTKTFVNPSGESVSQDLRKPLILRDFGIKRISNKELLKQSGTIKRDNTQIQGFIGDAPSGVLMKVFIETTVKMQISDDTINRTINFETTMKTGENIRPAIINGLRQKGYNENQFEVLEIVNFKVLRNNSSGNSMKIQDMILREQEPPSISNLYTNVIENTKWKHCIHDYMIDTYKKQFKLSTIQNINTTNDIYNFCKDKYIKMIAYDINGNCIASNYPTKNSKLKKMIFIAYNNHLYPLKSEYLEQVKYDKSNIIIVDDALSKLIEVLKQGRLGGSVKMDGSSVISFYDGDNHYIQNDEYIKCKEILGKFGLEDKIYDSIKIRHLGTLIQPLYIKNSDKSNFINHSRFSKDGFVYNNDELEGEFKTIDHSKHYPAMLHSLKRLILVDMVSDDLSNDLTIDEDHYLYVVEPEKSSILLPNTNIYTGYHLKYCIKEGLKFNVSEKLKTRTIENHYKLMIEDLYKRLDKADFKSIMNVLIGKFENQNRCSITKFIKIVNNDELNTVGEEYFIERLNEDYHSVFSVSDKYSIYNKKPIAIQIKDESRRTIYDMMKTLKLDDTNIKSINTDAITFKKDVVVPKKFIGCDFGKWKYIDNKEIKNSFNYNNQRITLIDEVYNPDNNKSILGICYAGTGKSYKIINEIIPQLNNDYIVMSPSHTSLDEYRKLNLNCKVIQHYQFNLNETPKASTIIIDEVGMVDRFGMHLILKWKMMGKRIIAFGDYQQLEPVGDTILNSSLYKYYVFNEFDEMNTNRRNNFTIDFYDSIINGNQNNTELIKKYRNENSNNIICYRNSTCKEYNEIIARKLNIIDKFSIGAFVMCNTNDLREYGIYNKMTFTIHDITETHIELNNNIRITIKDYSKKCKNGKPFFDLAYARTLHSYQGSQCNDFFTPDEELKYCNDRFTYTLISRLKGNVWVGDCPKTEFGDIEYDDYEDDEEHEPVELDF